MAKKKADPVFDDTHAKETHAEDTVAPAVSKARRKASPVEEKDPDAKVADDGPGEYPRRIYGKGRLERTVDDANEHKRWAAKGYKDEPSEAHLHELGIEF